MTDHPSTFKGEGGSGGGIDWDDRATLHVKGDGQGIFDGFKSLRSGSLAELVSFVSRLPDSERGDYVIQKAGDHRLDAAEIAALAHRDDFPG